MSKALVIRGVDFSENKLDTVTLTEEIPCAAISLSASTMSLNNIGTTGTLTATVTPANTTDEISWSTSNGRIATVSTEGVVTVTGAGTVTITAICGTKTATCTVTTTHTLVMNKSTGDIIFRKGTTAGAKNAVIKIGGDNSGKYACAYQTTPLTKKIYKDNATVQETVYPIYFGHANTLTITAPSTIRVTAVITDSTKAPDGSDGTEAQCAMWLQSDASQFDPNVPLGNRTITDIPDAADSVGFSFQKPDISGGNISSSDIENIVVVAS